MNFVFQNPEFLYALLILPFIAILFGKAGKRKALLFPSIEIAKTAASKRKYSWGAVKIFLRLIPFGLIIVAFARPQIERGFSEESYSGIDIVLTIDTSASMLALDFSEDNAGARIHYGIDSASIKTRLDVAKEVLSDFISKREHDRIGLVVFSGAPYLVSPLTLNHDWLTKNLDRVEYGMVPEPGTAIGTSIATCVNRLRDSQAKSRIVILLTDGENTTGDISPSIAAETARAFGIKVYTVAIGRNDRVNSYAADDRGIIRDRNGRPVIIQAVYPVNFKILEEIAEKTNAKAFQARNEEELRRIYDEINQLEKTDIKVRKYATYEELFFYFLIPAILLLLLEKILASTWFRSVP